MRQHFLYQQNPSLVSVAIRATHRYSGGFLPCFCAPLKLGEVVWLVLTNELQGTNDVCTSWWTLQELMGTQHDPCSNHCEICQNNNGVAYAKP
jgi:hypothetical protein